MKTLYTLLISLIPFVSVGQIPNYVPQDGLVAWWPFNGNANDEYGNGNNGTVNGATLTTDRFGNSSSAYDFDGNDWIAVSSNSSFDVNQFTISLWGTKTGGNTFQHYLTKADITTSPYSYNGYAFRFENNDITLRCNTTLANNAVVTSSVSNPNNWNHYVAVYDQQNDIVKLYVNGTLVNTSLFQNSNNLTSIEDLFFGVEHPTFNLPSGPQFLTGKMDDIGYWNRELDSCEIQDLYNSNAQACCTPTYTTDTQSACDSYTWIDGNTYTTSNNTATFTLTNSNNCDSIVTLDLIINNSDNTSSSVTACESYEWNGQTYTESGTYEYSEQNNNEYSISFDGIDDYLSNTTLNPSTNSFSIMIDVMFNDVNNGSTLYEMIAQKWSSSNDGTNGFSLRLDRDLEYNNSSFPYLRASVSTGNIDAVHITTGFEISSNTFYNLCIVINRITNQLKFYVDSELIGSEDISQFTDLNNPHPLEIGRHYWTNGAPYNHYFNGAMDNFSYWNYPLNSEQINQYRNCPPTGSESGLVGYWNFEEGEGNTVYDLTGNGNDGIINDANYSTEVPENSCQLTTINGCDSVAVLNLTITQPDTSFTEVTACESYEWNGETYTVSGTYECSEQNDNEYSMSFDGDDDYINYGDILNSIDVPITFIFDVKFDFFGTSVFCTDSDLNLLNDNYFGFWLTADSTSISCSWGDGGFAGGHRRTGNSFVDLSLNNWYNLAVSINGPEDFQFYLDGNALTMDYTDSGNGGTVEHNSFPFTLGVAGVGNNPADFFKGNLDNLQIWDIVLSEQDIQTFMSCPPTGNEEGLVGYWNFEEGEGNIAYDLSGNGNNGTINGAQYDSNVPSQSCQLTTVNGCDSVAVLNLTIIQPDTSFTDVTACDEFIWHGQTYSESGEYTNTYTNVNGCDSIAVLNLTITQPDTSFTEVTACESYEWNGETYTVSGTYEYSEQNDNEFSMSYDGDNEYVNCGNGIDISNKSFTLSVWVKKDGADFTGASIVMTTGNGTINNGLYFGFNYQDGEDYLFLNFYGNGICYSTLPVNIEGDGEWYHIAATYNLLTNERILYLDGIIVGSDISQSAFMSSNTDFCIGITSWNLVDDFNGKIDDACVWDRVLTQSEIQNYVNCPPTGNEEGLVGYWNFEEGEDETVIDISGNGNDGTINGASYSTDVPEESCQLMTVNGCDSVAVLNLTITQPDTSFTEVTACESYEWNGQTYTESGEYTNTYTNTNGCDSTHTLNLTINSTTFGTDTQEHCDTYTWIDGNTYTASNNTATHTLTNAAGCDSVVTLDLTINSTTYGTDTQVHCDTYTWIDGNTYTETNNTATFTLINSNNCDSIVTLDLIINNSDNTSSIVTACDEFTWDGQTYTESGEYTNTYTNLAGCDSIVTLDLIINNSDNTSTSITACDEFTWDGQTYTESGEYINTYTNANGCDSTHTLNLTINNSISSNTEASSCSSYEWNGIIYENSGTYEFDTIASNGCDSTAVLELEICYLDQLEINGPTAAVTSTTSSFSVQENAGSIYEWSLSNELGEISSGQNSNEINVDWSTDEGLITICVLEKYDCSGLECLGDTICLEVEIKSPNSIVENNLEVNIYPNPSSNIFNLEFISDSETEILVTNILGEQVHFESIQSIGEYNTQIDLSNYSKGIYNLTIKISDGISNHKLILQ